MDLDAFRQMVAKNPKGFLGRYGLGNKILQEGGNLEEAVEHLRVAVQLDPVHVASHLALGRALASLGRNEEANRYSPPASLLPNQAARAAERTSPPKCARCSRHWDNRFAAVIARSEATKQSQIFISSAVGATPCGRPSWKFYVGAGFIPPSCFVPFALRFSKGAQQDSLASSGEEGG
jgi:tetratricopeptide (TPR) repeat protein